MAEKTRAVVRIAGREYTIRANEPEEYIHRVAIYANRKMEEVSKNQPNLSTTMAAILTVINLGDEVLKERDKVQKLEEEIENLKRQVEELEEALQDALEASSEKKTSGPAIYDVFRKEVDNK